MYISIEFFYKKCKMCKKKVISLIIFVTSFFVTSQHFKDHKHFHIMKKFSLLQHSEVLESVCSTAHFIIHVMSLHFHTANI
jgi:hypothetical protein